MGKRVHGIDSEEIRIALKFSTARIFFDVNFRSSKYLLNFILASILHFIVPRSSIFQLVKYSLLSKSRGNLLDIIINTFSVDEKTENRRQKISFKRKGEERKREERQVFYKHTMLYVLM